jgi:antirestriction protein ArdC
MTDNKDYVIDIDYISQWMRVLKSMASVAIVRKAANVIRIKSFFNPLEKIK